MQKNKAVIILGTAHLATTPGKQSPDGRLKEYAYSRALVADIKAKLEAYDYHVMVDFEDCQPCAEMKAATVKEQQSKELSYRVKFVNAACKLFKAQNCIYVSVHVNAAGAAGQWLNARGWSAYTSVGTTKADKLAECLYKAAETNLSEYAKTFPATEKVQKPIRRDTTDGDSDMEAALYVLKHTDCAAVLTENMFMDNKADTDWLLSEAGKHALARLHIEGIIKYIESA